MTTERDSVNGITAALTAYVIWGVVVVYWKLMPGVPAWEILAHRVVWCLAFLAPIVLALGRWPAIVAALSSWRSLTALVVSSLLIAMNWGIFIWAVQQGRIVETALGYYINPLLAILIGVVMLGERLSRWRTVAFGLAAAGVAVQAVALGGLPWIALVLASSFAVYGYVRKVVNVQALDGLFVETMLTAPLAGLLMWHLAGTGELRFGHVDMATTLLMMGAGPVTAIPLWLFAVAARGVRMSTIGFLQYVAPTISLVIAVWVYDEPFGWVRMVSFGLIWAALAVVTFEMFRRPAIVTPAEC